MLRKLEKICQTRQEEEGEGRVFPRELERLENRALRILKMERVGFLNCVNSVAGKVYQSTLPPPPDF